MDASPNSGRDETIMVDAKDIESVLSAIDGLRSNFEDFKDDVNEKLSNLTSDVKVITATMAEREKSRGKEDTERRDMLKEHERLLRGTNGMPGLVAEVMGIRRWIAAISWIGGACILAVAVDIVLRLFHLI